MPDSFSNYPNSSLQNLLSIGELSTKDNASFSTQMGSPNTFVQMLTWLTASNSTAGVVSNVSGTANLVVQNPGYYMTSVALSFSGSTGTYTFSLFQNGVQHPNCQVQQAIPAGQGAGPFSVTLSDVNIYAAGDTLDLRVKSNNAGASYQMQNGNFIVFKVA